MYIVTAATFPDALAGGPLAKIQRIAGATRFETAARIADSIDDNDTVFMATGADFPDALAAVEERIADALG